MMGLWICTEVFAVTHHMINKNITKCGGGVHIESTAASYAPTSATAPTSEAI